MSRESAWLRFALRARPAGTMTWLGLPLALCVGRAPTSLALLLPSAPPVVWEITPTAQVPLQRQLAVHVVLAHTTQEQALQRVSPA